MVKERTANLVRSNESLRREIADHEKTDEALEQSEDRYRQLYRRTLAMLQSFDCDFKLSSVSDHWLEVMGYKRDEVIGRRITEFVTEESRQLFQKESLPQLLRTGVTTDLPRQLVKESGELIDTLISTIVERDDTGEPAHFLSVIVDVTERKRAEEALKESETRLSIAHAVAGVGSWDLDMVNEEMYWSDQTFEILGLSPAQVAPSASQFLPLIHHEDRADVDATMEATLEDRQDTEMEYRIVRPDGAQRTVVSRALIDTVVNGAPIVLWAVDQDGRVTLSMGRGLEGFGLGDGGTGWQIGDGHASGPDQSSARAGWRGVQRSRTRW